MKRDLVAVLVLAAVSGWCLAPAAADASVDNHSQLPLADDGSSSPNIHKHREGVILPLGPTVSAVPLTSVDVEAEAAFFSCMVRNLIINVRAEFTLGPPTADTNAGFAVAFPITTHALYGDHNQFRDITVTVNNAEIACRVAMDHNLWSTWGGELKYKGRVVNNAVHPLLEDTKDLNLVAPHLVARGFDLVVYWHMPPVSTGAANQVVVEYTSNSNDFSGCCNEVRDCTYGSDPYHFYFDLGNARYWRGPTSARVVLRDSQSGEWASVPTTDMTTTTTADTIELTTDPASVNAALEDIAVPAQPAVFGVDPRRWPNTTDPPAATQGFTLSWLGGDGGMINQAVIDQIEGVGGILVNANLPMVLSEHNPTDDFWASFMPPLPELAYIDVIGSGYYGQWPHGLYDARLRIPLRGQAIMGHDLAVNDVKVIRPGPGGSSDDWAIGVTVANKGLFTEPLLVTINVNNVFVKTEGFRSLLPGDEVHLTIPIQWVWELPSDVEVEVEPAPGEVIRMNNAAAVTYPGPPMPRHAHFVLQPGQSKVVFNLPDGISVESKLIGGIQLYLGDPDVPVIGTPGTIGLSVDRVALVAPFFDPTPSDVSALPHPLFMFQHPDIKSVGSWNYSTGEIQFEMYLVTPDGELPAQQPTICYGRLSNAGLSFTGLSSEPTAVPRMIMDVYAYEAPLPPVPEVWFSAEVGFHAGRLDADVDNNIRYISPGDLLSVRGHVVRTNHELTRHLGIMPIVPDLGLDAVVIGPRREIWFSWEEEFPQMWSETLGVWLKHGDLLSDRGYVVATNEELLARFVRQPVVTDAGLDAVARAPTRAIFFSTEEDFFSEALGVTVRHGDLLSSRGRIVRTNAQLTHNFNPMGPALQDYGLDAVILRPWKEVWFSTEKGFTDANLGPISDGDLLSSWGYVVARNLELVERFGPIEDLDNFGLDAVNIVVPSLTADMDFDGDVDQADFGQLQTAISGPDLASDKPELGDFNGDGDVDQDDFGVFQICLGGANVPGNPDCAE